MPILEMKTPEDIELDDSESRESRGRSELLLTPRVSWSLHDRPPTSVALRDSAMGGSGAYGQ